VPRAKRQNLSLQWIGGRGLDGSALRLLALNQFGEPRNFKLLLGGPPLGVAGLLLGGRLEI
jgi:hypothetical protein